MKSNHIKILILCLFLPIMPLHAYTDPGAGALIYQILLAGGIGALFYAKRIFFWIKSLFKKEKLDLDKDS